MVGKTVFTATTHGKYGIRLPHTERRTYRWHAAERRLCAFTSHIPAARSAWSSHRTVWFRARYARLLRRLIEDAHLDPSLFSFTELDPLIDSSNATPDNWQTMADDLRAHRDDADAFVVLHGTDTMSYSSAALSYALTGFGKPVIFTGSQHPLGKIESDATANVTGALNAAMSGRFHGVGLFFGHHLFAGNRVSKSSSWAFEGFSAPSTGPLARTGTPWHWYAGDSAGSGCGWTSPLPYSRHDVAVIDMAPGISAARLAAMLDLVRSGAVARVRRWQCAERRVRTDRRDRRRAA